MRKHTQVREKNLPCSESRHDRGQQDNETSKMKARCWGSWFTTTYSWSSLQAPLLPDLFRMCSPPFLLWQGFAPMWTDQAVPSMPCIAAKLLNVFLLQKLLPIEIPTTYIKYEDFDSSLHAGPMTAFYSGFKVFVTSLRFILNLWHVWLSCEALQIMFANYAFTWVSHLWSMCMNKCPRKEWRLSPNWKVCQGQATPYLVVKRQVWEVLQNYQKPTKEPSRCWKMMKVMSPYCSFFVYSSSRVQIVRQSSKCSWIVIRAVVLQTLQRQDRRCMYVYIYIEIMHGVHFHVATRTANIWWCRNWKKLEETAVTLEFFMISQLCVCRRLLQRIAALLPLP